MENTSAEDDTACPPPKRRSCCSDGVRYWVLVQTVWRDSDQSGQCLCAIQHQEHRTFAQHFVTYRELPHPQSNSDHTTSCAASWHAYAFLPLSWERDACRITGPRRELGQAPHPLDSYFGALCSTPHYLSCKHWQGRAQ